jgi:hypothetical protein
MDKNRNISETEYKAIQAIRRIFAKGPEHDAEVRKNKDGTWKVIDTPKTVESAG